VTRVPTQGDLIIQTCVGVMAAASVGGFLFPSQLGIPRRPHPSRTTPLPDGGCRTGLEDHLRHSVSGLAQVSKQPFRYVEVAPPARSPMDVRLQQVEALAEIGAEILGVF
jgi:hypothetical protein